MTAAALGASAVLAAPAAGAITVTSQDGERVASFDSLSCKRTSKGALAAVGREGADKLRLLIRRYKGPGRYVVEYGFESDANLLFKHGGDLSFVNFAEPQEERLTDAGAFFVERTRKRTDITVGVPIVYDSNGADAEWVRVIGEAACR
ncbi:MAG TPA: hypothetical protein VIL49_12410 [Capillimicrobium sp.]